MTTAARPTLQLQTLTRGDGLLGMRAAPGFGPRGAQLTVARAAHASSAAAQQALQASGLRPLPAAALQWRTPAAGQGHDALWSLPEEGQFSDFWAEQVPRLQAEGWAIVVQPGFAHFSVPVQRWTLRIDHALVGALGASAAAESGRELAASVDRFGSHPRPLRAMRQPAGQGSWRVSLGVDVDGETLDLVPMLAGLLKTDARWLDAAAVAAMDDAAIVTLRAPGGRRVEAPAGPLKAIVSAMLDLLLTPRRAPGPLLLTDWEAQRVETLRADLADSDARRAPSAAPHAAWQLHGDAGLSALVQRLRTAGQPPPVAAPTGLGLQLRPYQLHGLAWLQYLRGHGLAGILADDMGLGKTAQVLAHLLLEQQAGRLDLPALAVLPTSLLANWQAEAARHAPGLRVLALQGPQRKADFPRIAQHDLVLTTYPLLWRDIDTLKAQPWHLLVLDEAQMAKNAGSRAARAARRLQVRHRLCVTGTPLENNLAELWAHFDLLMPGFLGDARSFHRLWRKPIEGNGETLRAQLLAQRVRPFILRRRKADVAAELPPLTEVIRRVQLQGRQRALYESVRLAADERVRSLLKKRGFQGTQIAVLDALLKLRQVCCDPRLLKGVQVGEGAGSGADAVAVAVAGAEAAADAVEHSVRGAARDALANASPNAAERLPRPMERAKIELLRDMLPALVAGGQHVLIFSQFTEMLALVRDELDLLALPYLQLTGQTAPRRRGAVVQQFQQGQVPLLLASLKAGGVGLNLTAADTVIHLDPWWNPAVEDQATARAHRIGQDRPVTAYKIVVAGSIEERMLDLQARKAALRDSVLGDDAALAFKFSERELQGLLAPLEAPGAG